MKRTSKPVFVPLILAGGTGTRLWPLSRAAHPKPFIPLPDGKSLLQKTFIRCSLLPDIAEILTVTNKEYYLKIKAEYEKCGVLAPALNFLLEPNPRNTAPAVIMAALSLLKHYEEDVLLLVLPADHLIEPVGPFISSCKQAILLANRDELVTFGIRPRKAETGFGYLECGAKYSQDENSFYVEKFIEKPNKTLAKHFFESKKYLWNSGMFCFKVSKIIDQFKLHTPLLYEKALACLKASDQKNKNLNILELDDKTFQSLDNISIDYAVMEKAKNIVTIRCDFDWQDVGCFEGYKNLYPTDAQGNTILGETILIDSENNFIHSENRMVASIGVSNLTIIDTPDALLITHRERVQDVKEVVQSLKNKDHETYLNHRTVLRPWGSYTVLEEGPSFKIKRILVKPHHALSLQSHKLRSEHWVVVEGQATVINGNNTYTLKANESTFVPMGTKHRLSNTTDNDLIVIEVQTGVYLGEDDIIRFDDTYGRVVESNF